RWGPDATCTDASGPPPALSTRLGSARAAVVNSSALAAAGHGRHARPPGYSFRRDVDDHLLVGDLAILADEVQARAMHQCLRRVGTELHPRREAQECAGLVAD